MRPISKTYTLATSGTVSGTTITGGTPMMINFNTPCVGIGFSCAVTGTVNYTVYHTFSDLNDSSITPVWFAHGVSNMVAATTTQESNFVLPITAMQVIINSGAGSVRVDTLQQGVL